MEMGRKWPRDRGWWRVLEEVVVVSGEEPGRQKKECVLGCSRVTSPQAKHVPNISQTLKIATTCQSMFQKGTSNFIKA